MTHNYFDDLNSFYNFIIALVITVYIFGHGKSNKLVHRADNPFLVEGLLLPLGFQLVVLRIVMQKKVKDDQTNISVNLVICSKRVVVLEFLI